MGGVMLPPAAWRDRAGLARVVEALGPGTTRIVGGAVRDTLLGIDTADVDLATTHAPEVVVDLLEAARIKAVPTGIKHGTITAVANDEVYEVTTLRRDLDTDGRHATVAFTDDWREDAARRDFTINALYADPISGEVIDYFDGIADLEARRVRFIGDPLTRIAEDHLRILRFFRFLARFGDSPDPEGLKACTERANDLMALSRERIANELLRLLVAPRAPEVVALMLDRGIFAPVLPEIAGASRLAALANREEAAGIEPDPIRRLAAILPSDPTVAADVAARLKLSKLQRRRLESAMGPPDGDPRALAYRLGMELAIDRLLLAGDSLHQLTNWTPPALSLSGGQLVAKGLTAGPDVARTLRRVEDRWVAEGFPDMGRVDAIADDEVAQVLADIRKS
ncbi:MAG: CCA tRNA nucleotidyltransferase [Sphingomonas sp.]|uniref:CCA tRNA nucleotidyltransferase n=1 Tax=Sphingomonas sp. TaxID=28214 RepID=UPI0011FE6A2D|nr:CCA tRNA nucleotidyltransferase [Sphingomonas sp.]THD37026.1 MAG: CCA tRNA nucleotidyltransferase [Sphingomonas sp.]